MRIGRQANPLVLFFMGVTFTIVGAAIVLFFACKTTLICERTATDQGICTLTQDKIWGDTERKIDISDILGAYVEERHSEDGTTYCVILETSTGEIDFSNAYSSGHSDKNQIASQINNFVKDKSQNNLYLEQDDRWLIFLIGGIFFIAGVGMILGSFASIMAFL